MTIQPNAEINELWGAQSQWAHLHYCFCMYGSEYTAGKRVSKIVKANTRKSPVQSILPLSSEMAALARPEQWQYQMN